VCQYAEEYTSVAITAPDEFIVEGFEPGVMPASYVDQLDEEQIAALVAYLLGTEDGGE
jgi:mono/diheme cytochrome c family protein